MDTVDFAPAGKCLRISSGGAEALVTLDVGPRIISFGPKGGPNLLKVFPDGGALGDHGMKHYGGHRLWYGPEDRTVTYQPDNDPVEYREADETHFFASRTNVYGIQKEIRVQANEMQSGLKIVHAVINRSGAAVELFPWALTVMAPGGTCYFPLPPFRAHTDDLLPAAPLVLWSYTKLDDRRWTWGSRVVRLQQLEGEPPQKLGALIKQGYAAYSLLGHLLLKRFEWKEDGPYPDMGCNFETFTNGEMLEVESVGPIVQLQPGQSAELREAWYLIRDSAPPKEDRACGDWLASLAAERGL